MVEPQVGVPQLQVQIRCPAAAALGLRASDLANMVETAFYGRAVGQVLEDQKVYEIVTRLDDRARSSRQSIGTALIDTPVGTKVPLCQVADVSLDLGPNTIRRENMRRRIVVQANVAGRDLGSVVGDMRARVNASVPLPEGYFVQYGGQFEAQPAATYSPKYVFQKSCAALRGARYERSNTEPIDLPQPSPVS